MSKILRNIKSALFYLKSLYRYPPGHFYSSIPNINELKKHLEIKQQQHDIPGIDLNGDEQFSLLLQLKNYYKDLSFPEEKDAKNRFYYKNNYFSYSDAIFLHSVIKQFQPKKIIEIGSGFTSAAMLDVNDATQKNIQFTFIDPDTKRLNSLLKNEDHENKNITVLKAPLQEVSTEIFKSLQENDILFIDSSHVVKTGNDVNQLLFNILPLLNKGVLIHFHDIFYPFEYPDNWLLRGRVWNEAYFLRAFLMYNTAFKIILFNTYLEEIYEDWFRQNMPLCLLNKGGSLWLRKI